MVFSAPSFLDLPGHGPFWRCLRRAAHMRIKYMFIGQRYGLMPAGAGGFCTATWSLTGIVGLGGQRSRRSGRQSPRPIRSVEDAAPGVAALPAHGLDREQHLLTIRTPRTTSSEIAVALWSSRTAAQPARRSSERAFQASQSAFTLRQTRLTVSLLTAPPNSAFKATIANGSRAWLFHEPLSL